MTPRRAVRLRSEMQCEIVEHENEIFLLLSPLPSLLVSGGVRAGGHRLDPHQVLRQRRRVPAHRGEEALSRHHGRHGRRLRAVARRQGGGRPDPEG